MSAALARRLEEVLREELEPRAGLEALLEACGDALAPDARAGLAALPLEAERERLAHWLVARLEQAPAGALRFTLALDTWHGRVDSADLELDGQRAGSVSLGRLVSLARWDGEQPSIGELLTLGCAALVLAAALERVDEALTLGDEGAREVVVELPGRAALLLGLLGHGGWERSAARLEPPS